MADLHDVKRIARRVYLVAALVAVLLALSLGLLVWRIDASQEAERVHALQQAGQRASQAADAAAASVGTLVRNVEFVLREMREEYGLEDRRFRALSASLPEAFPDGALAGFEVAGPGGELAYSSLAVTRSGDVSSRTYLKAHRAGEDRLLVGKPMPAGAGGGWALPFTRPVLRGGRPAGTVAVLLSADYLGTQLATLEMGDGDQVALFDADGTFLARSRGLEEVIGRTIQPARPFMGPEAPPRGILRAPAYTDGSDRIIVWARVAGSPLVAVVAVDARATLAPLEREFRRAWLVAGTLAAGLLALGTLILALLLRLARGQQAMAESEARFRAVYEQAAMGVGLARPDGRWLQVNRRLCEILGYTRDELLARTFVELTHPEDRALHLPFWTRIEAGEIDSFTLDKRYLHKSGDSVWVNLASSAVRDTAGAPEYYIVVLQDVTVRKFAERQAQLEHSVTRCLADPGTARERMRKVMRALCRVEGWDRAEYWAVDAGAGLLRRDCDWAPSPARQAAPSGAASGGHGMERGSGLQGRVWQSAQPLWIADLAQDAQLAPGDLVLTAGARSALLIPVLASTRVAGVLVLLARESRPAEERLFLALGIVGREIGQFMERMRVQDELEAQTERFLFGQSAAGMLVVDWDVEQDRMTWSDSPAWLRGPLPADTGQYPPYKDQIHPEDRAQFLDLRTKGVESLQNQTLAYRVMRTDGEVRWVESQQVVLAHAGGRATRMLIALHDITERKRAEEALRRSEERMAQAVRVSEIGISDHDHASDVLHWSAQQRKIYGFGAEDEVSVEAFFGCVFPADRERVREAMRRAHDPAGDGTFDIEHRIVRRDGEVRWIAKRSHTLFAGEGQVRRPLRTVGAIIDITARKRDEALVAMGQTLTQELAAAESPAAALNAALRTICVAEGWECARYFEVDASAGVLRHAAGWAAAQPELDRFLAASQEITFRPGEGLAGCAWQSGEPLWVRNVQEDARSKGKALAREAGLHGAFVFPVTSEGRCLGVASFNSRAMREPDAALQRALGGFGVQIGQLLLRKEAEQRMRERELQERVVASFSQHALSSETDLGELRERAVESVVQALGIEFCSLLELKPDSGTFVLRACAGYAPEWIGRPILDVNADAAAVAVIGARDPVLIGDYAEDPRAVRSDLLFSHGIRSSLSVAVLSGEGVFGVLGAQSRTPRRFGPQHVNFVQSVANTLASAIERKSAEERLIRLAQFDTTTGLPNRVLFSDRLEQILAQAQRNHWLGGVLFVDLDRFKAVNDTLGHERGDRLLELIGARLAQEVRSGDTVGRLSGDEFAVALSNLSRSEDAGVVAEKIIAALAAPFDVDGHRVYVSASIGIALYPNDGASADVLLRNADTAMYRVKSKGRNGYQFYMPEMNARVADRLELETDLRGALERGEFLLHYQPTVRLRGRVVEGLEALMRWNHPRRGTVPPAVFIPLLEDTGLIVPAGDWVVREACRQICEWRDAGLSVPPIAVNLSARQFQDRDLHVSIAGILGETGVAPGSLRLEITESLLMHDAEAAAATLRALKELGIGVSVDDFGTGYSSLGYLKRFTLDALKIDRSFISEVMENEDTAAITLAIIHLARSLKLQVIAEGVETRAQADFLAAHDCEVAQGYYFSRPLGVEGCAALLRGEGPLAVAGPPAAARRARRATPRR